MPRQLRLYQHRHKVQWLEQPGVSAAAEAGGGGAKYGRGSPRSSCSGGGGGGSVEGRGEEEPAEPVFCFEAALKCLYWSLFSYRHKEVGAIWGAVLMHSCACCIPLPRSAGCAGQRAAGAPRNVCSATAEPYMAPQGALTGGHAGPAGPAAQDMERGSPINTGTALGLFGLQHFETFWAQELDAKCLLGWGPGTIVIAFRGTASMQNALSDLKASGGGLLAQAACSVKSLTEIVWQCVSPAHPCNPL